MTTNISFDEISYYLDNNNYKDLFEKYDNKILSKFCKEIYKIIIINCPELYDYFKDRINISNDEIIKIVLNEIDDINISFIIKIFNLHLNIILDRLDDITSIIRLISKDIVILEKLRNIWLFDYKKCVGEKVISDDIYKKKIKKIFVKFISMNDQYNQYYKNIKNFTLEKFNILIDILIKTDILNKKDMFLYKTNIIKLLLILDIDKTEILNQVKKININTEIELLNFIKEKNLIEYLIKQRKYELIYLSLNNYEITQNNIYRILNLIIETKNINLIKYLYNKIVKLNIRIPSYTIENMIESLTLKYNSNDVNDIIIKELINVGYNIPKGSPYLPYKKGIQILS
jgi:hypothetical protein